MGRTGMRGNPAIIAALAVTSMLVTGCAVSVSNWSGGKTFSNEQGIVIHRAEDIIIAEPDKRLPEYETLTFTLKWIGISVGTVTMSVKGVRKINERDAYVLEAAFQSNRFLSAISRLLSL